METVSIVFKMFKKQMKLSLLLILSGLAFGFSSLKNHSASMVDWERPSVCFPDDNPFSEASVDLGGKLFFESLLSRDTSIDCQSCHMLTLAFADHLPVGEGIKGRTVSRNTPTLVNIGLHPYFMADGKFSTLEEQVLGPIEDHREFDMTAEEVIHRLKDLPRYKELSHAAYGEDLSIEIIQKALANFQRIIVSRESKFDQYMEGELDLTQKEMEGWQLFKGTRLNCIQCHSDYNFTNYSFENNGLYATYADEGRALVTKRKEDIGKFKVPTLRNIAITYPYMHDGSLSSLEQVIDHYASGGKKHEYQSDFIKGFSISEREKEALLAFLGTLTDKRFIE